MNKRVTGIGGIFFKCRDRQKVGEWYNKHLGLDVEDWGGSTFHWIDVQDKISGGMTLWSPFAGHTKYFEPSEKEFMINYRVENLEELMKLLEEEGVQRVGGMEVSEFGKFAWVLDPEGNKIELWEPPKV